MEKYFSETMMSWMNWENTVNYGLQTLLLLSLIMITVYRKEFSCNHCYSENRHHHQQSTMTQVGRRPSSLESKSRTATDNAFLRTTWFHFLNMLLPKWLSKFFYESFSNWRRLRISDAKSTQLVRRENIASLPRIRKLTEDAFVEIMSFLHPKDVMAFALASRDTLKTIERSRLIWKNLWYRDYAWIVEHWDVGQKALTRSLNGLQIAEFAFSKEFYFRFGLSYLNYLLSGHCTAERCLVGLRGHIYDLTKFLSHHPGSPETLLAHAGRDATSIFECLRHSVTARQLAQDLCIIVDCRAQPGGCGARPTLNCFPSLLSIPGNATLPSTVEAVSPGGCPAGLFGHTGTIESIRDAFLQEQHQSSQIATRWLVEATSSKDVTSSTIVGHINPYYDPFCAEWKAWYMDSDLNVVFVNLKK